MRVVVVGAGALGGWCALALRRRGADVVLIDAFEPGHPRGSSGGESRLIRAVYGDSEVDTAAAVEAMGRWRQDLGDAGHNLLIPSGLLWLVPRGGSSAYLEASLPLLQRWRQPLEQLSSAALAERYPMVWAEDITSAWFEPNAGILLAREACRVVAASLEREGGRVLLGQVVAPSSRTGVLRLDAGAAGRLEADHVVFAAGPWLPKVFPQILAGAITPTRQDVVFVGAPAGDARFHHPAMPAWIELGERIFYGMPAVAGRGIKVADDTRGVAVDPDSIERIALPEAIERQRQALARRFPALAGAPVVETRVCQYENSTDGALIVDRHPDIEGVWVVGGGSGHAFKLGPSVGRMVADAIVDDHPLPAAWNLARLGASPPQQTQFERGAAGLSRSDRD
jgi:glycine/D-amino acid oxidase-like deaminating enzyme